MVQTIDNTVSFVETVSGTTHTATLTLGSGTSRKIIVMLGLDIASITVTGVTFDGIAMTERLFASYSGSANNKIYIFSYDVPDGAGTGNKDIVATTSAATTEITVYGYQTTGSATGAFEYTASTEATNTVSAISDTNVAVTNGAAVFAIAFNSGTTRVVNSWTTVTERYENDETNYTTAVADATSQTAGTKTVTATWSGIEGNKLLGVISVAEAAAANTATISWLRI